MRRHVAGEHADGWWPGAWRAVRTENVPYIVGLARALELACENLADRSAGVSTLRDD